MVLIKIAIVAAAIGGLLAVSQQQRWWERAGLMSSCTQTAAPYGAPRTAGEWWSCREGVISGYPSLVRDNCESRGFPGGKHQLWYCPSPINQP